MKSRLLLSLYLLEKSLLDALIPTRLLSSPNVSPSRSNPSSLPSAVSMFPMTRMGGILGEMPEGWEEGVLVRSEEPVQAFRAWRARAYNGSHYLLPLHSDHPPWPHYERHTALCPHLQKMTPGQTGAALRGRGLSSYTMHTRYTRHPEGEPAPWHGCSCGIYVMDDLGKVSVGSAQSLQTALAFADGAQVRVVGSCRIWGRMTRHERGWRAQYCYPERLFILVPPEFDALHGPIDNAKAYDHHRILLLWKETLETNYGVPVGFAKREDMEALGRALSD